MSKILSGRFVLRLPVKLHAALRRRAEAEGLSLNRLCVLALSAYVQPAAPAAGAPLEPPWLAWLRQELHEDLLGAVLFGSEARGEARRDSDIDLLLIVDSKLPLTRGLYALWDERSPGGRHSPHFVHLPPAAAAAGSIWLEASVDGILLYDRDGRVSRFLGLLRRAIASGRLKRKTAYGHPYWVKAEGEEAHDE